MRCATMATDRSGRRRRHKKHKRRNVRSGRLWRIQAAGGDLFALMFEALEQMKQIRGRRRMCTMRIHPDTRWTMIDARLLQGSPRRRDRRMGAALEREIASYWENQ